MHTMTSNEIRRSFLKFFEAQGHRIVPSSPLVPHDDPTLLFTNAGMNQFKDVFLGKERREYRRATTSQKCMRVSGKHNDLENVGPSLRHHTFFEMLGNFSFGDYFKNDAIPFAWTLLTEVWKLPAERLHASVFAGFAGDGAIPRDDDAYDIWRTVLPADRIVELGIDENFWSMGETGPCGRCSEIHYFRGDHLPCPEPACRGVSCSCDRFVEVWNNVFMEFDRQADGALKPLPAPSIDTGMGLERITSVLQDKLSNYDTDLFTPIIRRIKELVPTPHDVSIRVVADHIRAMTFLIADDVVPSNEGRGYVLRKIMRRAMRHGKHLGMTQPFLHKLVDVIAHEMGDAYPDVRSSQSMIERSILAEENRFDTVLNDGLPRLEAELSAASGGPKRVLAGDKAFKLYDTFGLPLDFVEDIALTHEVTVDHEGFESAMEAQRKLARASSMFEAGEQQEFVFTSEDGRKRLEKTGDHFEGYTTTRVDRVPIVALFDHHRNEVTELTEDQSGFIVLEETPFYLEAGGQMSDVGQIRSTKATAGVDGVLRVGPLLPRAHRVRVTKGAFRVGDHATATVEDEVRDATRRNHTATHLLHAVLRQVLGTHVKQRGSLVAPDRLRFDFVHDAPLTHDELQRVEEIVNREILRNVRVETQIRATQEAIAAGAVALFGEKYGDMVRVVTVPGFSVELCGGTHCSSTGEIGLFLITEERGVAAGVRRVEAITGLQSLRHARQHDEIVREAVKAVGGRPQDLPLAIGARLTMAANLRKENQVLKIENQTLKIEGHAPTVRIDTGVGTAAGAASASGVGSATSDETIEVAGVRLVARRVEGLDKGSLRDLADTLRHKLKADIVVLGQVTDGKASVVVSVAEAVRKRAAAGDIVKRLAELVGGRGGGRADFAEAGGKNPEKLDEMLSRSGSLIKQLLEADH